MPFNFITTVKTQLNDFMAVEQNDGKLVSDKNVVPSNACKEEESHNLIIFNLTNKQLDFDHTEINLLIEMKNYILCEDFITSQNRDPQIGQWILKREIIRRYNLCFKVKKNQVRLVMPANFVYFFLSLIHQRKNHCSGYQVKIFAAKIYHIPNLNSVMPHVIANCEQCQTAKNARKKF